MKLSFRVVALDAFTARTADARLQILRLLLVSPDREIAQIANAEPCAYHLLIVRFA